MQTGNDSDSYCMLSLARMFPSAGFLSALVPSLPTTLAEVVANLCRSNSFDHLCHFPGTSYFSPLLCRDNHDGRFLPVKPQVQLRPQHHHMNVWVVRNYVSFTVPAVMPKLSAPGAGFRAALNLRKGQQGPCGGRGGRRARRGPLSEA